MDAKEQSAANVADESREDYDDIVEMELITTWETIVMIIVILFIIAGIAGAVGFGIYKLIIWILSLF